MVRLHTRDAGWEKVRALAATDYLACCLHGQAETVAAFHRKFRESVINRREFSELLAQFERDCKAGAVNWLPLFGGSDGASGGGLPWLACHDAPARRGCRPSCLCRRK